MESNVWYRLIWGKLAGSAAMLPNRVGSIAPSFTTKVAHDKGRWTKPSGSKRE
jgi:hypothetical protein